MMNLGLRRHLVFEFLVREGLNAKRRGIKMVYVAFYILQ